MLNGQMTVVGDLTADGHIAINYVTSIDEESPDQEQIVHYCDNLKFETVIITIVLKKKIDKLMINFLNFIHRFQTTLLTSHIKLLEMK